VSGRAGRFDLVIEAAGTASAVESAIALARRGERVILITHRFPLDRFAYAYQALRDSDGSRGKVMLDLNPA
jgi:threonine dehydrogenase-like Zn-dependent dehydrogenase